MSIELVIPPNHLILCHPLFLLSSVFPSIRVFSSESILRIRWPKCWSFSFKSALSVNIQDWFPLGLTGWISLQSKGPSSFLQHHNSKPSILQCSAFFIVHLSHPYMTTGKITALTRWTKVMYLLFNILSILVIAFLPRSKHLLISWLQSPSEVVLEPKKTVSHCFHYLLIYLHEVMGPDAMIFLFWMLTFKPTFSLFFFTFIKRLFSSSSLSAIRVVSSAYQRLLIFLPAILTPACALSSPAFHMIHSTYKLNKQGDNIQPWHTPFPIWNQSLVPHSVLNVPIDLHTDFSGGR